MEYPMITIIGGGRTPISLYGVISHELAHMWWPMVAGSDERSHAWMDEGLASFSEDLFTPELFPGVNSGLNSMNGYLRIAGTDRETESMRPADLYGPFGNRGTASYGKPASVFRALRHILTDEVFDEAMRAYLRRWAFKHPNPLDLFWTFEDVTGRDLDWYFFPWMYTTGVMDQSIVEVRTDAGRQVVVIEDRGEIPMPVVLRVTTDTGQTGHIRTAHDVWQDGRAVIPVAMDGTVVEVIIDPEQSFPDVNRADNRWAATNR
jgi:aminopeptidase N